MSDEIEGEPALHEAVDGPSRIARLRDSINDWKLAIGCGLLVLLATPIWLLFVTPLHNDIVWPASVAVAYTVEVVALVAIGRWARRVAHPDISPGSARLALALVLGLVPLALLCAVSSWRTNERAWSAGFAAVAVGATLYFGSVLDRLHRRSRG